MRIPLDTVLMVIDLQKAIDDPCWGPRNNPGAEREIAGLLAAWRDTGMSVVHVRHDSTEPRSPYRPGQPLHAFKPEAEPLPGEPVFAKTSGSAFVGTELESWLAERGHTTLVVCGVLTHNSVETTVRHAGCMGFRTFVAGDACWATDRRDATGRDWPAEAVHALSLANLDGEYAAVVTAREAALAARLIASRKQPWRR